MSTSLYHVEGTAGNVGMPGAPILHFNLVVEGSSGKISGQASITQALPPPNGNIRISNVTGQIRQVTLPPLNQLVSLEGTYGQAGPPGTNYIIEEHFSAHFAVDSQWNGRGGFEYGGHIVDNVPVRNDTAPPIVTLYGVVIHEAQASGDLARMNAVAAQAEAHIAATPAVQSALTALKAEIAKAGG
jgi:Domain of unknown function (DUF1843)/Domain of unknown function (DUF1842)